ncbi:importin subunit alpha-2-like protein [Tanacetum coccineum]
MSATVSRGQSGDGGGDDPSCPPARPSGTGCRDVGRRRMEDNMVEIRNNKREDNLLKKRRALSNSQPLNGGGVSAQPSMVEKKGYVFASWGPMLLGLLM